MHATARQRSASSRRRVLAGMLAGCAAALAMSVTDASAAGDEKAKVAVEIGVTDRDGHELRFTAGAVALGEVKRVLRVADQHEHEVEFSMREGSDGHLSLALTYELDGKRFASARDVAVTASEPVTIEGEGCALVFVARPAHAKIEVGDSDDPLAGL